MANVQYIPKILQIDAASVDGGYKVAQGFREGSISFVQFHERMAAAGRVMSANFGTVVTQLTFLAQAANRPDAWIRVPSGTTIIPLKAGFTLGAMAGTVTTIDIRQCENDIGNGTSSAASVGPQNLRTDAIGKGAGAGTAGNCTARQLATADTTAETNPITLYKVVKTRADEAAADLISGINHISREMMGNPWLVGPATWEAFIWATTTQATGYGVMTWIETPSTWWA